MTTRSITTSGNLQTGSRLWSFLSQSLLAKIFRNLSIGVRLIIGFGILVFITLLVVGFSYLGSDRATENINRTGDVRVPTALASARAQADLLKMLGDVHIYLALGQPEFRESYEQARQNFENDLDELRQLSPNLSPESRDHLNELEKTFVEWSEWPDKLFELRDDQLEREPAYRLLATDGILLGGTVLIDLNKLIEAQGRREATNENIALLADMANFQGTFASLLSGLRGYVTTRNRIFRGEYEANLAANEFVWDRLEAGRESLTPDQQTTLDNIQQNREAFLQLPDQMFEILESDRHREDLYLFRTETVPRTEKMQQLLDELTGDQQVLLQTDLNTGRVDLARANRQTLLGGLIALVSGLGLAFIFRENIAGPVRRLTGVAEQIRAGHLEAQARIESGDEIGTLAETFNNMTRQLNQILLQVQREKKRADDLLNVVIPIGVELSSEKDFNRLLENILVEAKSFCHADAGILYLRNNDQLEYVLVRNDTLNIAMGGAHKDITFSRLPALLPLYDRTTGEPNHTNIATHVALTGATLNIPDISEAEGLDFTGPKVFDDNSYKTVSYLTIPLTNSQDQVEGILQLINAQDPEARQVIPFDQNLQQMMESFSLLAVAALEAYKREQSLKQQIQQLRIEIDEAKRQKQVSEIVDSESFADLQAKAREARRRRRQRAEERNK